jgi:hypothetical protein
MRVTVRLTHHPAWDENQTVTPRLTTRCADLVFSTPSRMATRLRRVARTIDENSNPTSAPLGVFVVMSLVPIVVYLMAVLVLPWVLRGFH